MTLSKKFNSRSSAGVATAAAFVILIAASPAGAMDCKNASTAAEKAICADPDAKAADSRMTEVFIVLKSVTPASDRDALLADQRNWLATRDGDCAYDSNSKPLTGPALSACLKRESDYRRLFLSGMPIDGPGLPGLIRPFFLKGKGSKNVISGVRFAAPQSAGERLFNSIVNRELKDVHLSDGSEGDTTDEFSMSLGYASPALVSAHITFAYEGSAHPMDYGYDINIDLVSGKELKFEDVFRREALEPLLAQCRPQLDEYIGEAAKAELDDDMREAALKDREEIVRKAVGDLSRWNLGSPQLAVTIDDPVANLENTCKFEAASLKSLMQPGFNPSP
jgi:uncharacterized protein YecT (DUF1311 family)